MEIKADSIKIAIVGDSGVGKTCIINRYTTEHYIEKTPSTMASYLQKFIDRGNKKIQLDIWDTAGQEKFRALGKHFYKDAYIIILVYDICVQESFENLKSIWYEDIKKQGEKYTVLAVVGNKCDRYEEEGGVDEDEARKFAEEIKAHFVLVSAKNGDNINNLFDQVVDAYLGPEFQEKAKEVLDDKKTIAKGNQKLKKDKKGDDKEKKCAC